MGFLPNFLLTNFAKLIFSAASQFFLVIEGISRLTKRTFQLLDTIAMELNTLRRFLLLGLCVTLRPRNFCNWASSR